MQSLPGEIVGLDSKILNFIISFAASIPKKSSDLAEPCLQCRSPIFCYIPVQRRPFGDVATFTNASGVMRHGVQSAVTPMSSQMTQDIGCWQKCVSDGLRRLLLGEYVKQLHGERYLSDI